MSRKHPLENYVHTTLIAAEDVLVRIADLGDSHKALMQSAIDQHNHALKMTHEYGNPHHDSRADVMANCRRIRRATDALSITVSKIERRRAIMHRIFPHTRNTAMA